MWPTLKAAGFLSGWMASVSKEDMHHKHDLQRGQEGSFSHARFS